MLFLKPYFYQNTSDPANCLAGFFVIEFRTTFVAQIFPTLKKLLLFFVITFSILLHAQMDVEHWFAPTFDSSDESQVDSKSGDYLYLSTDKTVPFEVTIYAGNVEINKVSISLGSPVFVRIPDGIVTTTNTSDVFSKNTKGLHVVGDYKFFANLRILRTNHAEIINSKGLAALGKDFYAAMALLYKHKNYYNSQIGIYCN